ncbi:uncharacterized protein TNCV_2862931 [Trichonephila clavipes]|nr:uncharacterized protein TNCV_2862931 [Trichonephila clavipes]
MSVTQNFHCNLIAYPAMRCLSLELQVDASNQTSKPSCQVIYSQFGLAIHQNDYQAARRRFVEWVQNEIAVVPDFHKRILFSDEAHFWLNGYVNKQNCRIWSEANPQVYVETPLHPEKLTVWCALWAGGIIGPYIFKNDEGHNVTVNGDRYRAMITNFFIPELNNHDVQELWFQQDGATCHTARATIDLLSDTLGDRLISRFGPVNWPPISCDLTPLDYFLWGYVKSLVYADKPQTLDHLEDNIRRVIADIRPQMLEKVIENWTSRLDYIRASRGSPMPEIIFKMRQQIVVANTTYLAMSDRGPRISSRQSVRFTPVIVRSFEHHAGDSTIYVSSSVILKENTLEGSRQGDYHLSFSTTNLTRRFAVRRLFGMSPCPTSTIHLQTSMLSSGFEPKPNSRRH